MLELIIVGILLLILAGERMNYVAHRKMAEHANMHWLGSRRLLTDGCPWFAPAATTTMPTAAVASTLAATTPEHTSGFDGDFMAHARAMDARKQGVPGSAAKKIEGIMASNDHARRKIRSEFMKVGHSL